MNTPPRSHAEQSPLERTLRSHLWQPTDLLARATASLPGHVRKKEYAEAAQCQTSIIKAKMEIEKWENLLALYEAEFQAAHPTTNPDTANEKLHGSPAS